MNVSLAYQRVCASKGAGGIDGVTVKELQKYMRENWTGIKEQIQH